MSLQPVSLNVQVFRIHSLNLLYNGQLFILPFHLSAIHNGWVSTLTGCRLDANVCEGEEEQAM